MSSHSDRPVQSLVSPSFTELISSIGPGSTSSDLPSLSNCLSSGPSSRGSDNGLEVQNAALILCKKQEGLKTYGKSFGHAITINILPDYVLLEIFDASRKDHDPEEHPFIPTWKWHGLAHVCRRWRQIVFGSPRRLDLQILRKNGTPVRKNLDIWPPFPISIRYPYALTPHDQDSLFAALEHPGRICYVKLSIRCSQLLSEVVTMIQQSLPALKHFDLDFDLFWEDERPPALPSGFLGGSAPRLQFIRLVNIRFPTLPALLSSASNLVELHLEDIPDDDPISPEAMAACLAALPKLKVLVVDSHSELAASYHDRIPLPPVTRTILAALTSFEFRGDNMYLEKFVSLIDGPQLNWFDIIFRTEFLDIRITQLSMFIDRSFEKTPFKHADVVFSRLVMAFEMYPCPESYPDRCRIQINSLSDVANITVFSQPFKMLYQVIHLKLFEHRAEANHLGDVDGEWLQLLCKFSAVRTLGVSRLLARRVAFALELVTGEMVTQVLPVLDLICLDGQPVSCVDKFLAARQLAGLPVTVVDAEMEFDERVRSYYRRN